MVRLRLDRQIGGVAILVVALSLCLAARTAAAQPTADLRGDWEALATVGTTTFPQTLHITSEDFTTGQIGGTDVGSDGATFALVGQISGASVTMTISNASYQSNTKATIVGAAPSLRLSGTFSDTNHSSGTFTASLSIPATISPPASAGSTVTPASAGSTVTPATTTISATADGQAATVINTPPADPGPANDLPLPLIAIGLAAVLLAGLGIAAATGLVPGMGLGGSATGSGGGQAGAGTGDASTPAPQQQIERAKIQQDARPSISPMQQDYTPAKTVPGGIPDPGPGPADQAPAAPAEPQQIERWKIQQDARPSISPIQQDTSANRSVPSRSSQDERRDAGGDPEPPVGPAPTSTAPTDTIGPASAVPTDQPPTA